MSYLLWLTQGNKTINEPRAVPLKTVPSAGCRHPFETYLSVNKVTGLEAGLYRFVASTHQLVALRTDADFNTQLAEVCLSQRHVTTSAVTFIWAAVPYRTVWRYSERSYRYLYLDAGHVCQNLYLAAESIHCGCAPSAPLMMTASMRCWASHRRKALSSTLPAWGGWSDLVDPPH